jgi:outer membrane protein TolC
MAELSRFARAIPLLLATILGGCAAESLSLAPERPDAPYRSGADEANEATGSEGNSHPARSNVARLRDYTLPPAGGAAAAFAEPAIDSRHVYSLAELIDVAQSKNPATRVAWEEARQAALGVGMVKALYLPALSAIAVGGAQTQSGSTQLGSLPSLGSDSHFSGTISGVSLQWLIFDFGERDALAQTAKELSLARNIAFNGVHQRIIYEVTRAFQEYAVARQRVTIAQQSKAESANIRDAATAKYRQGVGTSVETAQANQLFAQAAFDLVQAQNAERDAYHGLISAIGISPLAVVRVQDVSRRPLGVLSVVPVERMIADAVARRPDVQASLATARAASASIRAAEADLLPKVFISASDTYTTGNLSLTSLPSLSSLNPSGASSPPPSPSPPTVPSGLGNVSLNRNDTTVLGGVTFPIYDGGIRDAHVREAQSRADAAAATTQRLEQAAATEVVAAADALRSSVAAYAAATTLVAASAVTQDAALSAYKSGAGTLTTAVEAERALLAARLAQAQAHGAALIAAATVAFSTGRISLHGG